MEVMPKTSFVLVNSVQEKSSHCKGWYGLRDISVSGNLWEEGEPGNGGLRKA